MWLEEARPNIQKGSNKISSLDKRTQLKKLTKKDTQKKQTIQYQGQITHTDEGQIAHLRQVAHYRQIAHYPLLVNIVMLEFQGLWLGNSILTQRGFRAMLESILGSLTFCSIFTFITNNYFNFS